MAKKKKSIGRIKPQELQQRILSLETLYGQRGLANILGVSADTIRRYRSGKSQPKNKNIYSKINQTYNKKKNLINSDYVELKRQQIEKRSKAQKQPRKRYAPIYPEYMFYSGAEEFREVRNFDYLQSLHERGYVAGWIGGAAIPLEVKFIIHGEPIDRWGMVVNIVGVTLSEDSPKKENNYQSQSAKLDVMPFYTRFIRGFKKGIPLNDQLDILRDHFFNLQLAQGYTIAFLGFYFEEE